VSGVAKLVSVVIWHLIITFLVHRRIIRNYQEQALRQSYVAILDVYVDSQISYQTIYLYFQHVITLYSRCHFR